MTAHLRSPHVVPAPPQLRAFLAERRFHTDFGVPSPPLTAWPVRKIVDYLTIMQELDAAEAAANGSSAVAGKPAATDPAAFDQLRATAGPPPMPPQSRKDNP